MNNTSKTSSRKTIVILTAILVLLVLLGLVIALIPAYDHYYLTHVKYPVYGGMTKELKDCELYDDMRSGRSICFLGDSITSGAETKGIPWYQPLIPYIKGNISNLSCGGWQVYHLNHQQEYIPVSDIYVVAIGINDIGFPKSMYGAHSGEEYVRDLEKLAGIIKEVSPNAKIYFIAPWIFFDKGEECEKAGVDFRKALADWSSKTEYIGIDPVPVLSSEINSGNRDHYLLDGVHPNSPYGTGMYSYAVLKADHDRRAASKQ